MRRRHGDSRAGTTAQAVVRTFGLHRGFLWLSTGPNRLSGGLRRARGGPAAGEVPVCTPEHPHVVRWSGTPIMDGTRCPAARSTRLMERTSLRTAIGSSWRRGQRRASNACPWRSRLRRDTAQLDRRGRGSWWQRLIPPGARATASPHTRGLQDGADPRDVGPVGTDGDLKHLDRFPLTVVHDVKQVRVVSIARSANP